jgi:outer membrane lipoprotein-sorting protein
MLGVAFLDERPQGYLFSPGSLQEKCSRPVMQRRWWSVAFLAVLPWLSGCLYHTHKVEKTTLAGPPMDASVAQLVNGVNDRYDAINSLTATVDFQATTGGARQGKQTDITPFHGYILLRKPAMLRVLALLPVVRTHAFDLASDGKTFKLVIPPKSRAIVGSNAVSKPSTNSLENLRPDIFLDSVLVKSITPDRLVYLTTTSETRKEGKKLVETPEYDLHIGEEKPEMDTHLKVRVIKPTRVIRFSRLTLMPIGQDIYDESGGVQTHVEYGPYKQFGTARMPSSIVIDRPRESYRITITVQKVVLNQPLGDEQFALKIPSDYKVQTLQ